MLQTVVPVEDYSSREVRHRIVSEAERTLRAARELLERLDKQFGHQPGQLALGPFSPLLSPDSAWSAKASPKSGSRLAA